MTIVLPNPFSPYADADPLYRHVFPVLMPALFGEPAPGTLAVAGCERMAVVPDEPLRFADDPDAALPAGLCPTCIAAMNGAETSPGTPGDCARCESTTRHNGLCALCRQEKHADWWTTDSWARPFRLVGPGTRALDGVVFPNGQAVVVDDPEQGLSSGAASLEQLLAGYHRAEVMLAEDVIRVGGARVQHAVGLYTGVAIELEDAQRERDEHKQSYLSACATIAAMHKAAVGDVRGPARGVVEDVEDVRQRADQIMKALHIYSHVLRQRPGRQLTTEYIRRQLDALIEHPQDVCDLDQREAVIASVRALAEAAQAPGTDGQPTDADTLWPSAVLAALDDPSQPVSPGETVCTCTFAEACGCGTSTLYDDQDEDDEPEDDEETDSDSDVLELISEIAARLSDATDEGEYHAVGLIGDLANGRKTIAEARAELAEITFRHV